MDSTPTLYSTVRITGSYGDYGEAGGPDPSTFEVARLCYQAMLACGHAPANVADAFEELGREHREALEPKEDA